MIAARRHRGFTPVTRAFCPLVPSHGLETHALLIITELQGIRTDRISASLVIYCSFLDPRLNPNICNGIFALKRQEIYASMM